MAGSGRAVGAHLRGPASVAAGAFSFSFSAGGDAPLAPGGSDFTPGGSAPGGRGWPTAEPAAGDCALQRLERSGAAERSGVHLVSPAASVSGEGGGRGAEGVAMRRLRRSWGEASLRGAERAEAPAGGAVEGCCCMGSGEARELGEAKQASVKLSKPRGKQGVEGLRVLGRAGAARAAGLRPGGAGRGQGRCWRVSASAVTFSSTSSEPQSAPRPAPPRPAPPRPARTRSAGREWGRGGRGFKGGRGTGCWRRRRCWRSRARGASRISTARAL